MQIAPYKPVSPIGSPDFPMDPGRTSLSLRPSYSDVGASDERPSAAASAFQKEQAVLRGNPDPTAKLRQAVGMIQEMLASNREAQAPEASAPVVPTQPRHVTFGEWMDTKYPEFAGRPAPPQLAQSFRRQYEADASMGQQMYQNDMARFQAELQAAKYVLDTQQGRSAGRSMSGMASLLNAVRPYMGEEAARSPRSIEELLTSRVGSGDIDLGKAIELMQTMRSPIAKPTNGLGGKTADQIYWALKFAEYGVSSPEQMTPTQRTEAMRGWQAMRERGNRLDPVAVLRTLDVLGLDLGDQKAIDSELGEGTAQGIRSLLQQSLQSSIGALPSQPARALPPGPGAMDLSTADGLIAAYQSGQIDADTAIDQIEQLVDAGVASSADVERLAAILNK